LNSNAAVERDITWPCAAVQQYECKCSVSAAISQTYQTG